MPRAMNLVAVLSLAGTLLGCGDSTTEPGEDEVPVVGTEAQNNVPPMPTGYSASCMQGADVVQLSVNCPVVRRAELTYWALSPQDNRNALLIVAYDASGARVGQLERQGSRYVWRITVEEGARTILFWGQGNNVVTVAWNELPD